MDKKLPIQSPQLNEERKKESLFIKSAVLNQMNHVASPLSLPLYSVPLLSLSLLSPTSYFLSTLPFIGIMTELIAVAFFHSLHRIKEGVRIESKKCCNDWKCFFLSLLSSSESVLHSQLGNWTEDGKTFSISNSSLTHSFLFLTISPIYTFLFLLLYLFLWIKGPKFLVHYDSSYGWKREHFNPFIRR